MNRLRMTVGNHAIFSGGPDACTDRTYPGFAFADESLIDYFYMGGMWIGAVVNGDTILSTATNGWTLGNEFRGQPIGPAAFLERTTRATLQPDSNSICPDVFFTPEAISDQDLITAYLDSAGDVYAEGHVPIGIAVTQQSHAWSYGFAQDFIFVDFTLRNIRGEAVNDVYFGLFVDGDVMHISTTDGQDDDLTGLVHAAPPRAPGAPAESLMLAWVADNDGDPTSGVFTDRSVRGVAGVRVLGQPSEKIAYNWWYTDSDLREDWGPVQQGTEVVFPLGNLGTPTDDVVRYQVMSNGERDYDQVFTAIDHQAEGWLPPPFPWGLDMANGIDTRYLLSVGPFDLPTEDSVTVTLAFVGEQQFHADAQNFWSYFDAADPQFYYRGLNFGDFVRNAQWAGWFYDSPGTDTDSDGFRGYFVVDGGDTVFYSGDGVPDYAGPPPLPGPAIRLAADGNDVVVRWNGENVERARDAFSLLRDFEGYRVYVSTHGSDVSAFELVASRDRVDYDRYKWDKLDSIWQITDVPFELDSLRALYDSVTLSQYGYPFHPDSFDAPTFAGALRTIRINSIDPSKLDTNYYYFTHHGSNFSPDDQALADSVDAGFDVSGVIRKVYPDALLWDTMYSDGRPFRPYFEYEYVQEGVIAVGPVYFAVDPFDFGFAPMNVDDQETPPGVNNVQSIVLEAKAGDFDGDGDVAMDDLIGLVAYLFRSGPAPADVDAADVNCDGKITLSDVIVLVNFIFRGGPEPGCV